MREISEYENIFLPAGQMLQIQRVKEIRGERIVCEQDLAGSWVFPLHFPSDPIFPGSLLIEGACQTIAIWAWENELRGDPRLVRVEGEFRRPVVPADRLVTYVGTIKRRRNVCVGTVEILTGGRPVARVTGSLVVTNAAAQRGPGSAPAERA